MATVGHAYLKILPSLQDLGRHLRDEVRDAERTTPPATIDVRIRKDRIRMVRAEMANLVGTLAQQSMVSLGFTAATGAALGLASALAQAGGSAAILPGVLVGVGVAAATAKLGLTGVSDALSALADGDPEKVAEAMGKLAPAARALVLEVHSLAPAFTAMRLDVQQALFAGLSSQVAQLGRAYLPMLRSELPGIATALNQGAIEFGRFAASGQTVADLRTIIANTQDALTGMAPAGAAVASVIRDVAVVGSEFLGGFGESIGDATQRFASFVAHARETGQLQAFLSQSLSALGDLLLVLRNVGSALFGVLQAGQETGAGLLSTLVDLSGMLRDFVRSAEGQEILRNLFTTASQLAAALLPMLLQLAKLLGGTVAPALADMGMALLQGGGLQALLDGVAGAVRALAPALGPIGQALAAILVAVSPLLPVLAELASRILIALADVLTRIPLQPFVAALIQVLYAVLPLVDPLSMLLQLGADLATAVLPALTFGLQLAAGAIQFVASTASLVVTAVAKLAGAFVDATRWVVQATGGIRDGLSDMASWAGRKVGEVVNFFLGLPGQLWQAMRDAGEWLLGIGHNIVVGLWNGLVRKWNEFVDYVKRLGRGLVDGLKNVLGIHSPSRVFAGIGDDLGRGLAIGINRSAPLSMRAAEQLAAGVADSARIPMVSIPGPRTENDATPTVSPRGHADSSSALSATGNGWDPVAMQAAVTTGVLSALDGVRMTVDGAGVAQLVNTHNARNARR